MTRHGSAADDIIAEVEALIRGQQLAPGPPRPLPAGHRIGTKQELCERFGVAPATLSEALRVLRNRGVIEVRPGPGGGAFVADASPLIRLAHTVLDLREHGATVNDVIGVLDALDEAVIRDAARHRRARDMRDLDVLMGKLAEVWHDPRQGDSLNWALHRRIAQISPNAVLRAFYQNMADYIATEGSAAYVAGFRSDSAERLQAHYDIVEAIRSQDEAVVRDVAFRHRTL